MYLGNLSHTSFAANETQINRDTVAQLLQIWKINAGATISTGVTAAGGSLFFGDWEGNFYSVDAATGAIRWTAFLGKAPSAANEVCMPGIGVASQAAVDEDTVYAAGGDSVVYALNRDTGEVRWQVPLADPQSGSYLWSSAMLSNRVLYVGIASLGDCPTVRGGLARIPVDDPSSTQIQYFMPPGGEGAGLWSTPAVDEPANLVYVTTGNASSQDPQYGVWGSALLALDATTLEIQAYFLLPITEEEDDADWGSSPVLFETVDGAQYVAANGKNGVMYVLSRPDLSPVWSYKMAIDCDSPTQGCGSVSTPAFDGNLLFSGAGQSDQDSGTLGTVTGFDAAAQSALWTYAARGAVLAPVTVTPGLVFVPTLKGLAILDASSGSELWSDSTTKALYGQVVVSNGVLYATYANGDVVAWALAAARHLVH